MVGLPGNLLAICEAREAGLPPLGAFGCPPRAEPQALCLLFSLLFHQQLPPRCFEDFMSRPPYQIVVCKQIFMWTQQVLYLRGSFHQVLCDSYSLISLLLSLQIPLPRTASCVASLCLYFAKSPGNGLVPELSLCDPSSRRVRPGPCVAAPLW